ncbi:hypothetical protein P691DRAFT_767283 [Macrolepiota fuliginosa MF-IS2]|uniref:Uncharacterized protein n=1 Tax=Macrolepiota fuliginosa MF-IS2 TaxID=1400762 RepID=A0A9P5WZF6_9AGAR|nr:hypothetical protein P691DRAFT_767283 [Macrolepiota fuliginosa MF-IS2]
MHHLQDGHTLHLITPTCLLQLALHLATAASFLKELPLAGILTNNADVPPTTALPTATSPPKVLPPLLKVPLTMVIQVVSLEPHTCFL